MGFAVAAAAVVVRVDGSDRYAYKGELVSAGAENLEHLVAVGLVSEVADAEPVEVEADADEVIEAEVEADAEPVEDAPRPRRGGRS